MPKQITKRSVVVGERKTSISLESQFFDRTAPTYRLQSGCTFSLICSGASRRDGKLPETSRADTLKRSVASRPASWQRRARRSTVSVPDNVSRTTCAFPHRNPGASTRV
ncbi:hypothetical protein KHC28_24080 [Ancylobacter sonchi]|uniref:hypothetical protein n=1 Tax=Ancylobacter sonchi TaxID=1937790 RepID=UPI001BD5822A|nr:hypothetical protein [Ancylobacter sonchi]MBS7536735.1 hypothetical protein [Ancylobacter sonchi]